MPAISIIRKPSQQVLSDSIAADDRPRRTAFLSFDLVLYCIVAVIICAFTYAALTNLPHMVNPVHYSAITAERQYWKEAISRGVATDLRQSGTTPATFEQAMISTERQLWEAMTSDEQQHWTESIDLQESEIIDFSILHPNPTVRFVGRSFLKKPVYQAATDFKQSDTKATFEQATTSADPPWKPNLTTVRSNEIHTLICVYFIASNGRQVRFPWWIR